MASYICCAMFAALLHCSWTFSDVLTSANILETVHCSHIVAIVDSMCMIE